MVDREEAWEGGGEMGEDREDSGCERPDEVEMVRPKPSE